MNSTHCSSWGVKQIFKGCVPGNGCRSRTCNRFSLRWNCLFGRRWGEMVAEHLSIHVLFFCCRRLIRKSETKCAFVLVLFVDLLLHFRENNQIGWKTRKNILKTRGMVFCNQNCSDLLWEKYILVYQEKRLKFEAEGQENAKILRSLEQFIQPVKGQNNFW